MVDKFAYNEYRDYITYKELAKIESNPEFKQLLEELVRHELEDYKFWLQFSSKKKFRVSWFQLFFIKLMRRVLGLGFTAKYLELHEKEAIKNYQAFRETASLKMRARIDEIIEHEKYHEKEMIARIKEGRVEFMGSIVLGLNDGLIELTGALVGFTFALNSNLLVVISGLVTGIAASLSMASSSFMQAKYDAKKDPRKAGIYTGLSYFFVTALLISPFMFISNLIYALLAMFVLELSFIAGISYYSSVLFGRSMKIQFKEMIIFSLGIAIVTFVIGSVLRVALVGA